VGEGDGVMNSKKESQGGRGENKEIYNWTNTTTESKSTYQVRKKRERKIKMEKLKGIRNYDSVVLQDRLCGCAGPLPARIRN